MPKCSVCGKEGVEELSYGAVRACVCGLHSGLWKVSKARRAADASFQDADEDAAADALSTWVKKWRWAETGSSS